MISWGFFACTATTAPTVVTSAATTATGSQATTAPSLSETCRALDTLRDNAQSLSCNRNDQCDTVYCTVTDSTVQAFVSAANLTLLPCNQPPAVRLTAYNPSGGVVLDRVISQSETLSLPQGATLSVTLNQLTNAIGFGVSGHANDILLLVWLLSIIYTLQKQVVMLAKYLVTTIM